jgi:hypothetical protein
MKTFLESKMAFKVKTAFFTAKKDIFIKIFSRIKNGSFIRIFSKIKPVF